MLSCMSGLSLLRVSGKLQVSYVINIRQCLRSSGSYHQIGGVIVIATSNNGFQLVWGRSTKPHGGDLYLDNNKDIYQVHHALSQPAARTQTPALRNPSDARPIRSPCTRVKMIQPGIQQMITAARPTTVSPSAVLDHLRQSTGPGNATKHGRCL